MRFVTTDPRTGGFADRVGSSLGLVSGGALTTLVKVSTGDTDWTLVRPVVIPAPMESTKCPTVSTAPDGGGGRAGNVGDIVLYYSGGATSAGTYYIKYDTADTDWIPLPDNNAGGPTGSGTAGRSTRWTAATVVGDGAFTDDGTNVSLGGTLTITPMTPGSVLFVGTGGLVSQDNTHLYWDDATDCLTVTSTTAAQAIKAVATSSTEGSMSIQNTNVSGPADFFAIDSTNTARVSFGYGNASYVDTARASKGYVWRNTGVNFAFSRTGTIDAMLFSSGNWNFGTSTSDPSVKVQVEGTTTLKGTLNARGTNTMTPAAMASAVEFSFGRTNAGAIAGTGNSDLAFQWGGSGGGYRHFVSTWHDSVAGTGNRIRFHVNNSGTAGGSSAPGTGNVNVLDLYGSGAAQFAGALGVTGATTLTGGFTAGAASSMGSFKITSLANGTASNDAAAFGQIATAVSAAVSGTANKVAKFTSSNVVGNGWPDDDGTTWGVANKFTITEASGNFRSFGTGTIDGNTAIGSSISNAHTISGGVTMTAPVGAGGGTGGFKITNTNTGQTANGSNIASYNTGSYDCTAAGRVAAAIDVEVTATRSTGANSLTNMAIYAEASGGQANYAFYGGAGTLYNAGDAQIGGALSANGSCTLGDAVVDAHTVNGSMSVTSDMRVQGNLSAYGSTRQVYYNANTLNWEYETNAAANGFINYYGYSGGATQFRSLYICDGKGSNVAVFDGPSGATTLYGALKISNTAATISSGAGTPEGTVTAPVGSLFLRTDGGASTSLYVKESGSGNTGWVAK